MFQIPLLILASMIQAPAQHLPDSVAVRVVSVPADADTHWLVKWTMVLGIGTLGLAVASWRSLHWLKEQGRDLKAQDVTLKESVAALRQQSVHLADQAAQVGASVETLKEHSIHLRDQSVQLKASVDTMQDTARRELRAYLTVGAGSAFYQDRSANTKFEARPFVTNTGRTPAYNVRNRRRAEVVTILTGVSPADAPYESFPLPIAGSGSGILGAGEKFDLTYVVDQFEQDSAVDNIKSGSGFVLLAWGEVSYDDIYGQSHWVKYSLLYTWNANNYLFGNFTERHNDSDKEARATHI